MSDKAKKEEEKEKDAKDKKKEKDTKDKNKDKKSKNKKKDKDKDKNTQDKEKENTLNIKTPMLMKKGDYNVHILIEEIKNAVSKKEDQLPSPVVKMTCFSQTHRTEKLKINCSDKVYNEHFYFDKTDLSVSQISKEKILIEVYDYNNSSIEDYLGIYELDVEYIYDFPNHCMLHTWIALANPESANITKINGFLRLSICVLNDNDPRIELTPSESSNTDECIVPSQIKFKFKQLSIQIFRGEYLPDDSNLNKTVNKNCNGYIEASYMGKIYKTSVVDMVNDVIEWNESINLGISLPIVSKRINFIVKDKDFLKKNLLGSFSLEIEDILNNKYNKFTFVHIYGASSTKRNKFYEQMNTNSEMGSMWKGMVLIKVEVTDAEKPVNEVQKIKDKKVINSAKAIGRPNKWTLLFKCNEVYYLPENDEIYRIKVTIQDKFHTFEEKKSIGKNISYYKGSSIICNTTTNNIEELPDIFIYLVNDSNKIICFQRLKPAMFYLCTDILVIKLIPEPCEGKVMESAISGLVKMKMLLYNNQNEDIKKLKSEINIKEFEDDEDTDTIFTRFQKEKTLSDNNNLKSENESKFYTLIINVYISRHIISGDVYGTSDLYVKLTLDATVLETSIKHNCINGIWNESLRFDKVYFCLNDKSTWPILYLSVMDSDPINDETLCYNYIWLTDMAYKINDIKSQLKPRWHQLLLAHSNGIQGQILLSAYILDYEHINLANQISILPETVNYSFEINVLGLRDLQPLSIINVKKAFVKFDLNSINFNLSNEEIQPVKTEPKESGCNPNITSIIQFNAMLPKDLTYVPNLQCQVCDYILNGFKKQNLGVFELDIMNIIKKTLNDIDRDIKLVKKVGMINFNIGSRKNFSSILSSSSDLQINDRDKNNLGVPLLENEENRIDINEDPMNKLENNYLIINLEDLNTFNVEPYNEVELNLNLYNNKYFVLKPVFKKYSIPGVPTNSKDYHQYYLEDESLKPDPTKYFPLGYNKYTSIANKGVIIVNKTTNKKHYRRIFNTELENVKELQLASPFIKCKILRDKYEDQSSIQEKFNNHMSNLDSKILKRYHYDSIRRTFSTIVNTNELQTQDINMSKSYGEFKAIARICEVNTFNDFKQRVNEIRESDPFLFQHFKHYNELELVKNKILTKTSVIIRVYILKLCDIANRDLLSLSDAYIKISLGNKKDIINEQNNYIKDVSTCDWYKYYDIPSELPGNGTLTISVYDYDPLFSDELIGETKIDIEDRFFDNEWVKLAFKPIEVRSLYHPDYKNKQGEVIMFLEIFDKKDRDKLDQPWNILPEPITQIQVRLIIYETEDIACLDVEGTSDIYITAYLENDKSQSTDIHYRCQTGVGSFNWRMIFDVDMPRDKNQLNFLVYDNDIFAKDDFICGNSINIKRLLRDANILDVPVKFNKAYYLGLKEDERDLNIEFSDDSEDKEGNKFWVQMYKNENKAGRVLCELEVLPMWKADSCPVGNGREEPNVNPFLPPPVGRLQFSLNPFTMINQCVGPKFRKKLYGSCIMCCLVTYCIFIIPYIIYYISAELVNPFNYFK